MSNPKPLGINKRSNRSIGVLVELFIINDQSPLADATRETNLDIYKVEIQDGDDSKSAMINETTKIGIKRKASLREFD